MSLQNQVTLKRLREVDPPEKWKRASFMVQIFFRPVSYPVTWLLVKLGFAANHATYLSGLVSVCGAALLIAANREMNVAGAVLFNLWAVLDCVDGTLARYRGSSSKHGDFVDTVFGYLAFGIVFIAMGVTAENTKALGPIPLGHINFIIIGAFASMGDLFMRLVYQRFFSAYQNALYGEKTSNRRLGKEFALTGLLAPLLLVSVIFNVTTWLVLFYAAFNIGACSLSAFNMLRKSETLGK
ncbi:MAG: hypothetical protein HFACDABA_02034 [Anaerolineales bacterium]|nr:hypothetical protein [Anaerolineales bacterium]